MQGPLPDKFGKFEVVREIGKGGFGVVYEGRDPVLKRSVAIKTCKSEDDDLRQRFQREAEIVASLQHPNITTVHDLGVEGNTAYLVQEYLSGRDLTALIQAGRPVRLERKMAILEAVSSGLEQAHRRGIIHRDIKPGNVRLLDDGSVKVMDFGIAKLAAAEETQLTEAGMMIGTAAYLAPEQVSDIEVDHRADIFSFGVLAYELLTYRRPFAGTTVSALLYKINHEQHQSLAAAAPELPAHLCQLIDDCLEKDPDARPISFTEVLRRLAGETVSRPIPARSVGPSDTTRIAGAAMPRVGGGEAEQLATGATIITRRESSPQVSAGRTSAADQTILMSTDPGEETVLEESPRPPSAAETAVTESAMSQMFSKASRPSVVAVLAMGVVTLGAVWFALSRGADRGDADRGSAVPTEGGREVSATAPDGGNQPQAGSSASTTPAAAEGEAEEPEPGAGADTAPASDSSPAEERTQAAATEPSAEETKGAARSTRSSSPRSARTSSQGSSSRSSQPTSTPREAAPARSADPAPSRSAEPEVPLQAPPTQRPSPQVPSTQQSPPQAQPTQQPPGQSEQPGSRAPRSPEPAPARRAPERSEPAAGSSGSTQASRRPEVQQPAAPKPVDHEPALRQVLSAYASAYRAMDGDALKAIWPSLSNRQLNRIERSFANTESMDVEVSNCRFEIDADTATGTCRVNRTVVPRAGRRQSNTSTTTFAFQRLGDRWVLSGT